MSAPLTVSDEHSRNGEACLTLTVIDDGVAEADECLIVSVVAATSIAPVSDFCCIMDNDGNIHSYSVEVCSGANLCRCPGFISEASVRVSGKSGYGGSMCGKVWIHSGNYTSDSIWRYGIYGMIISLAL